jgi:hypothetical protein
MGGSNTELWSAGKLSQNFSGKASKRPNYGTGDHQPGRGITPRFVAGAVEDHDFARLASAVRSATGIVREFRGLRPPETDDPAAFWNYRADEMPDAIRTARSGSLKANQKRAFRPKKRKPPKRPPSSTISHRQLCKDRV